MNRTWMVAVVMVTAMEAQPGLHKPQANALVTVFTYDGAGVPWDVMARARRVATAAFARAGIEVKWVWGERLEEPRHRRRGGRRNSPLADFYIDAHAAVGRLALLTLDTERYRNYFPKVAIPSPTKMSGRLPVKSG